MHNSLTWQFLPQWLLYPVMQGAISLAEASELWDLTLTQCEPADELPTHLHPAFDRIELLLVEAWPTSH
jgi:hypothetical protein